MFKSFEYRYGTTEENFLLSTCLIYKIFYLYLYYISDIENTVYIEYELWINSLVILSSNS